MVALLLSSKDTKIPHRYIHRISAGSTTSSRGRPDDEAAHVGASDSANPVGFVLSEVRIAILFHIRIFLHII